MSVSFKLPRVCQVDLLRQILRWEECTGLGLLPERRFLTVRVIAVGKQDILQQSADLRMQNATTVVKWGTCERFAVVKGRAQLRVRMISNREL